MNLFDVSLCICTRNRPDEVRRALQSVLASSQSVFEVIVSDDSTDALTRKLVLSEFSSVRFVEGPRRGLCANRNNAIRHAKGSHIAFIDDDVVLDPHFVANMRAYRPVTPGVINDRLIVTGLERNNGVVVYPKDQNFLGYQRQQYRFGQLLKTIVINSTIFPAALFEVELFDENLVYGYDEVDLATRAVARRFTIELCTSAVNAHFPASANRDMYLTVQDASRLYVTFKRYVKTEHRLVKAALFAAISPIRLFLRKLRTQSVSSAASETAKAVTLAFDYWVRR